MALGSVSRENIMSPMIGALLRFFALFFIACILPSVYSDACIDCMASAIVCLISM